jgi:magnesium chelatase family protein
VRDRVIRARRAQEGRLGAGRANSEMTPSELRRHCQLDPRPRRLLEDAHRRLGLSARGWDRCVRLARTIADLAGAERIAEGHISEAINRRSRPET